MVGTTQRAKFHKEAQDNHTLKKALGKIWTNPAIGLFLTQRLGYCPEGWVKHLTQQLVENNPIAGFVHI